MGDPTRYMADVASLSRKPTVEAEIHCPGCLCPTPTDTAGVLKLWAAQEHNDRVVAQLRAVGLESAAAVVTQLRPAPHRRTADMTDHTCRAVEHCHTLNERMADLEGLVRTIGQNANEDINALRELTNKIQGDASVSDRALAERLDEQQQAAADWHNALAQESRAHAADIQALQEQVRDLLNDAGRTRSAVAELERKAGTHCRTCFCEPTR